MASVIFMNTEFTITKIDNIILVGKNEYAEKTTSFNRSLKSYELIYHFSGKSTVRFNGQTLYCEKDTLRFLPKGNCFEYVVDREERGECIDIFFDTNIPLAADISVRKIQNNDNIANLFRKIFSLWVAKNEGYYFECISLLYKIFAQLQKQNYIPESQYNAIKPAIDYINKNFASGKISVEYLAKLCNISESYLEKLFHRKFSLPPAKYIIQLRINYSADLMRSGLYSVSQVSEICGYSNVYFFSRQFKEYMGITPSEFIKKYKSSK